jgi:hypothetical protein
MTPQRTPKVVRSWENLALLVAVVLFGVISVGHLVRGGLDQPWWLWVVLVAFVLAILRFAIARQATRMRVLRSQFPHAYVHVVALYALPVRQLSEAPSVTIHHSLRPNTTGVLVLNGRRLEIYGGLLFGTGGRPHLLASTTLAEDTEVTIERAAQGRYFLDSLSFISNSSGLQLDLCPMRISFGMFITTFRSEALSEQRTRAVAALNHYAAGSKH